MSVTITEIRNAVSTNDDNTEFELEINHPEYGWITYILHTDDPDNTVDNSELLKLIGSNYKELTADEKNTIAELRVRNERDNLLRIDVDPIVSNGLLWADLTTEKQNAWKQYRTDLLNIPQQSGFPSNVTYPTRPS